MEEMCKSEEHDLMVTCELETESMIASSCHSEVVPSVPNTSSSSDIEHKMHIITQRMKSLAAELTGVQNRTSSSSSSSSSNAAELTGVQNRASSATFAEKRAKWKRKIAQRTKDLASQPLLTQDTAELTGVENRTSSAEERAKQRVKMMLLRMRMQDFERRQYALTRAIRHILDPAELQKINQKRRDLVPSLVRWHDKRHKEMEMLSLNERIGLAEQRIQEFEKKLSDDFTTLDDQLATLRTGVHTRTDPKYQEINKILAAVLTDQTGSELNFLFRDVRTLSAENKRRRSDSESSSKRPRIPSPMKL